MCSVDVLVRIEDGDLKTSEVKGLSAYLVQKDRQSEKPNEEASLPIEPRLGVVLDYAVEDAT